jgi:hypothetical protein
MKTKFTIDLFIHAVLLVVALSVLTSFAGTVKDSRNFKKGVVEYVTTRGK